MCWIAWHPRDLLKFYSSLSKCNVSVANLYEFARAVMLIEGFGSRRRQCRSQSPSLDQRSGERETLVKSRKRQIRWAVEKQFKFPGTVFCFYFPNLSRVSTVEEESAIYFQNTRGLTVRLLYTVVSRSGLTHSQNTAHARVVIQPQPQFSASGFGSFQSLPHLFRRTRVTEALRTRLRRRVMFVSQKDDDSLCSAGELEYLSLVSTRPRKTYLQISPANTSCSAVWTVSPHNYPRICCFASKPRPHKLDCQNKITRLHRNTSWTHKWWQWRNKVTVICAKRLLECSQRKLTSRIGSYARIWSLLPGNITLC